MLRRSHFHDEHQWFRESVATFVDRRLIPRRPAHRADRAIDRESWLEAGDHGFLSIGVPAAYGGSDVEDFRFNQILNEELARAGMAYGSSFSIHTDVCLPYLLQLSTADQRERWLPRFVTGEMKTAIAMTEPEAGSDLKALRTTASFDGGAWRVDGAKTFITNGASADLVIVAARTDRGITLFAVEAGTPGFRRGRTLEKSGQHEADTAELFFDDVRLDDGQRLGDVGRGFAYMMEHLAQERLGSACLNTGHAAVALEQTIDYIKERRAFGRPIGSFQHNRFVVADLVTRLEVTQAYVDQCVVAHSAGQLSPTDAAKAKWWSAQVQHDIVDACVQLHGGYGYMDEYDIAHAWADARVTRIWAGSNEIMKELIGRSLGLGDPQPVAA